MTFSNSPGIYDREIDASVATIQAAGSPAAFVANLDWGPVLKRKILSNEDTLVNIFNKPKFRSKDFLLASQFLAYSNNLILVRINSGKNSISSRTQVIDNDCGSSYTVFNIPVIEELWV